MPVFEPVDPAPKFAEVEQRILAFWKARDIFHKSLEQRRGRPAWVFYEGPPTANGRPHPGHVLTRVVKDLFPRYKTMRGFHVPRKAGWDTHGLPVEVEVEKELQISGKQQIEEYGVEPFVRKCMESVFRYTRDWEELTERLGFWIDLPEAYVTYHQSYVESVWWSLQQLFQKNLLYQGYKILPWCPRCRTALSSHEVGQGYRSVEDPAVFVTFRCEDWETSKTSFLVWTTTPWTLPSNAGLAVKADTEYSRVRVAGETLILAGALVEKALGKIPHEVVGAEAGSELVGRRYRPLFDWWQGRAEERARAWKVCAADFVTLDTGTGIVHVAPAFGADDYELGRKEELPVIQLVDAGGKLTAECGPFAGRFVKEADGDLVKDLRARGLLLRREGCTHEYPFCWRCDSPLLYFPRQCWFIRTTSRVPEMLKNNRAVDWHPEHIRDGRFGNFLESNVDWALSRERYWGTPLPIWKCAACGQAEAVGAFAELRGKKNPRGLEAFDSAKARDPSLNEHLRVHKPWIDQAAYDCPRCGGEMRRVSEVVDCWYDSGAMPFAQWGYPRAAGSKEQFERAFPADFISEALDQTRGWFYSLLAESTLLFPQHAPPHPFRSCVVLGHVCDEKGLKQSKHLGNYLDPMELLNHEGADALRWFFFSTNHPWTNSRFSRPAVREGQREFLLKLRNVYSFFVIYAGIDGFDPAALASDGAQLRPAQERGELDRWILGELHRTVAEVRARLDEYDIFRAAGELAAFAESLSNWYVRRSRDRFWRGWRSQDRSAPEDRDKLDAYWTLYECLTAGAQVIAPFTPFLAEELWQNLVSRPFGARVTESVHLCDYPVPDRELLDETLAAEMALVREMSSLGRAARAAAKLKTRQPLARAIVLMAAGPDQAVVRKHEQVLKDELNVKRFEFEAEERKYVTPVHVLNFKALGEKHRGKLPSIKATWEQAGASGALAASETEGKVLLALPGGEKIWLTRGQDYTVQLKAREGFAAAGGKHGVVILDTRLTPELLEEGLARELVKQINGFRAELKLKYEARIRVAVQCGPKAEAAARKLAEYIRGETLAVELKFGELPAGWRRFELDLEGEKGALALREV